jgi:predicted GNAT superfamily acetyltransferase
MNIRPLHTIDEFRRVLDLEKAIWGYEDSDDAVGIPVFVITVKRGGILLGAFDGDRMIGFVYSLVGVKHGRLMQWSHMLGVLPEYRASGVGRDLKLVQRRLALDAGFDLMEWTYDPLVAVNAHLNFRRLGVVADEYVLNVYGDSSSPLHQGAPTDRFIAQWWMRTPRVDGIVAGTDVPRGPLPPVPVVNRVVPAVAWLACASTDLTLEAPELAVIIPAGFNEMLEREPMLGHEWRLASREIFSHYLEAGYRAVDFAFGPGPNEGRYLLTRRPEDPATGAWR